MPSPLLPRGGIWKSQWEKDMDTLLNWRPPLTVYSEVPVPGQGWFGAHTILFFMLEFMFIAVYSSSFRRLFTKQINKSMGPDTWVAAGCSPSGAHCIPNAPAVEATGLMVLLAMALAGSITPWFHEDDSGWTRHAANANTLLEAAAPAPARSRDTAATGIAPAPQDRSSKIAH